MAWSAPKSWTTGYKVLASDMNTFLSDNDTALRAGGLAISSQAANDVLYASSTTQLARLGAGTAGKVLTTQGTGSAPTWETPTTGDITSVVAGAGMTGGGTAGDVTLNVIGTADKITVNANDVTIASTYVGQTSITTLGTVATGTWQATDVGVAYGGTGVSTLASGRVLIGAGASAIATTGNAEVNGHLNILAENDLRLQDASGGQYVGFDAPATVSTSYTLTFPAAIGSVNQLLTINNVDGTLQWATAASTTPGGSDAQVQYNDGGSTFGGDAGLVYNDSTNLLTVDGVATEKIVFPATQVASGGVNTLDDYEEGTWDPELGGSTSETGQTYNTQLGTYVKVGKIVYCAFYMHMLSKGTIVGSLRITGLPFTVSLSSGSGGVAFGYWTTAGSNISGLQGTLFSTGFHLQDLTVAGGTPVAMDTNDIGNCTFVGTFMCHV